MPQILSPNTPQLDVRVPLPTPVQPPAPKRTAVAAQPRPAAAPRQSGFVPAPVGSVPKTVILPHSVEESPQ